MISFGFSVVPVSYLLRFFFVLEDTLLFKLVIDQPRFHKQVLNVVGYTEYS